MEWCIRFFSNMAAPKKCHSKQLCFRMTVHFHWSFLKQRKKKNLWHTQFWLNQFSWGKCRHILRTLGCNFAKKTVWENLVQASFSSFTEGSGSLESSWRSWGRGSNWGKVTQRRIYFCHAFRISCSADHVSCYVSCHVRDRHASRASSLDVCHGWTSLCLAKWNGGISKLVNY